MSTIVPIAENHPALCTTAANDPSPTIVYKIISFYFFDLIFLRKIQYLLGSWCTCVCGFKLINCLRYSLRKNKSNGREKKRVWRPYFSLYIFCCIVIMFLGEINIWSIISYFIIRYVFNLWLIVVWFYWIDTHHVVSYSGNQSSILLMHSIWVRLLCWWFKLINSSLCVACIHKTKR